MKTNRNKNWRLPTGFRGTFQNPSWEVQLDRDLEAIPCSLLTLGPQASLSALCVPAHGQAATPPLTPSLYGGMRYNPCAHLASQRETWIGQSWQQNALALSLTCNQLQPEGKPLSTPQGCGRDCKKRFPLRDVKKKNM